jgi:hypothetical protein
MTQTATRRAHGVAEQVSEILTKERADHRQRVIEREYRRITDRRAAALAHVDALHAAGTPPPARTDEEFERMLDLAIEAVQLLRDLIGSPESGVSVE